MIQDIIPQTYEELILLDAKYATLSEAMGRLWMRSKRRASLLRDIRSGVLQSNIPEPTISKQYL